MPESSQKDLTNYDNQDLLVFTDAAASKVKDLIEEEKNDSPRSAFKKLRDASLKELTGSFVSGQLSAKVSAKSASRSPSPNYIGDYEPKQRRGVYDNISKSKTPPSAQYHDTT